MVKLGSGFWDIEINYKMTDNGHGYWTKYTVQIENVSRCMNACNGVDVAMAAMKFTGVVVALLFRGRQYSKQVLPCPTRLSN